MSDAYERLQRVASLINAGGPRFLWVNDPPKESIAAEPFFIVNVPTTHMECEIAQALLRAANLLAEPRHPNWNAARARGEHPETLCMRCGEKNVHAWFIQNAIWNQVMRHTGYEEKWSIVCPQCFSELAEERFGEHCLWELRLDLPDPELRGEKA